MSDRLPKGTNKALIISLPPGARLRDLSWNRMNCLRSCARQIGVRFSSAQQGNGLYSLVRVSGSAQIKKPPGFPSG